MNKDEAFVSCKRKKGVKQVEYQCEKIKKARLKNEDYINYKGNIVKSKEHGFHCRCRWKCIPQKMPEGECQSIYVRFIDFTTKNEQDAYLQSLIECKPIHRHRSRIGTNEDNRQTKPKSHTFKYTVSTEKGKAEVCKNAFLSIHGITADRVKRLCKLLAAGKSPKDLQGKSNPGNTKPVSLVKCITDHISSFPHKEAHYTTRVYKYLSANLNVKLMWSLFKEKHPHLSVNYKYYLKIFNETFDLTFGRPQVDSCCKCEELSVKIRSPSLNDAAKRMYTAELIVHKRRAKKFYTYMKHVKEKCIQDSTVVGICLDFMQNLQLPEIPVQEVFYLRQLTLNVFNIHNLANEKAKFYLYHEGIAKKGPNEVCSFVYDYINSELDGNVRELHIFSDGAAGQNKNHTLIRMLLALVDTGRFDIVHHYFPIRGHSYLPGDRDFSVIKRKLRKTDRIYTAKHYMELMLHSTVQPDKFQVKMISTKEVIDFKKWWPTLYKRNVMSVESSSVTRHEKQKFAVSSFMEFVYSTQHMGQVLARPFIGGLVEHTFRLAIPNKLSSLPTITAFPAYPQKCVPIHSKKIEDLKKLKQYIPTEFMDFYNTLFVWPVSGVEEVDVL